MDIFGDFSLKVLGPKLLKRGVVIALASKFGHSASNWGITVDPQVAGGAAWLALESLRNFLKTRFGWNWL